MCQIEAVIDVRIQLTNGGFITFRTDLESPEIQMIIGLELLRKHELSL